MNPSLSSDSRQLMEFLMKHISSAEARKKEAQRQTKTKDEICRGCGHSRSRHIWGAGHCTCSIPLGGGNPASTHCRCAAFGESVPVDTAPIISTVEDRRDNRDPNSQSLYIETLYEVMQIRRSWS